MDEESTISKGLLMTPSTAGYAKPMRLQHTRSGSTGTGTGDESYTTDEEEEEDNLEHDEPDCSIKEHVTSTLYRNSFGSFSDVATIADATAMHRNSSDSSVYSDLGLDKCEDIDAEIAPEWSRSVVEVKEQAFARLQNELKQAHQELKLKDEEVARLSRIRQEVESELEDLTASLFQEAHNMVREANLKQAGAEKSLHESQLKVDVLSAEVSALKTLVLTSTPSKPNPHLHPQIDLRCKDEGATFFAKKHRRCPSHFNLKYGRENSPPESPVKETNPIVCQITAQDVNKDDYEVDPIVQHEFLQWKENPAVNKDDAFIKRIYEEDILPCLSFKNKALGKKVMSATESGTIFIEAVADKNKATFPRKCALLEVPKQCFYRMNIGEPDEWYSISKICRNRIIAVCDFLNYLKYINRGLVKSSAIDIYWEIARLRKDIVLAKLGLTSSS